MADSLNSDPRSSNADHDPTPKSKKVCKNPILDIAILESCGLLRRSPRIVTSEPEKRSLAEIDDGDNDDDEMERRKKKKKKKKGSKKEEEEAEVDCELDLGSINGNASFVGDPVSEEEAKLKWPHRYEKKVKTCNNWNNIANIVDDDDIILKVKCHYLQANVNGCIFNIGDCAYVKIPDWTMNLWEGKSLRPYSQLWWDEIVPTVLTVPDSQSQTVLHPEQDRVLTIRESARVQGFPDHYKFCGTVKQRYR